MAYDGTTGTWLDGWTEDGTDITVPIATFPEMTAAEADATTGDIRKVMFAIIEKVYNHYNGLAEADRPTKMTITKSGSLNTTTGVLTNTYTLKFFNEITTQDVSDE